MNTLIESLLQTLRKYSMVENSDRVLVAVSGGLDSVALLHALWSLRDDLGINLHVAHLNHSFRGTESDADAQYVRDLTADLGLECIIGKVNVPEIQRTLRLSPEEAARVVRYEFLEKTAESVGAAKIAIAHTADDQCETVLLNILRGTGLDGLSGMPPVREKIIRPLIEVRRTEVETYLAENGLIPCQDSTNLTSVYTRNRVRNELLPQLRHQYNSDVDSGLLRLAELARADSAYLNNEAETILRALTLSGDEDALRLDTAGFVRCAEALRRRVVRLAVKRLRGDIADIGYIHVEELLRLLDAGADFEYGFPGGTYAIRVGSELTLRLGKLEEQPTVYAYVLSVPGETVVTEIDAVISAKVSMEAVEYVKPRLGDEAVLDFACVRGKIVARNWQPGDSMRPLGLGGSKKVQDIFTDAKIPKRMRSRVPLIVDEAKILWVAGLAVSDEAKVTGCTSKYLEISVTPR